MNQIDEITDSDIIDFYYSNAVKGIKEEWLVNLDEKWYNHINSLPEKEKVTYHIIILDEEVNNGGFNQYFINGYGQFVKDTVISLKLIKANKTALIIENAFKAINKENLDDNVFRSELLNGKINRLYEDENLDDFLNIMDEKYSKYEDNLGKLLGDFLRKPDVDNVPN